MIFFTSGPRRAVVERPFIEIAHVGPGELGVTRDPLSSVQCCDCAHRRRGKAFMVERSRPFARRRSGASSRRHGVDRFVMFCRHGSFLLVVSYLQYTDVTRWIAGCFQSARRYLNGHLQLGQGSNIVTLTVISRIVGDGM